MAMTVVGVVAEEKNRKINYLSLRYMYQRSASKKRAKEIREGVLLNDCVRLVSICLCVSRHKAPRGLYTI